MLPDLVAPPDDFAQRAKEIASAAALPGLAARQLCDLVRDEVEYLPGTTDVHTTARRSWQQRAGVCQDMTHLVIGGLRSVGIPARYVSGYHHPSDDPVLGEPVVGASHAWVEWWDDGWHPFDLTHGVATDDRYVVVATGRDYDDVKPLSGIYSGAATTEMTVSVEVTRLA
jgi:transglutaminase-like putative cysteine protease